MDFREESFLNGFGEGLEKVAKGGVGGFLKKQLGKVTMPAKHLKGEVQYTGGKGAGLKRYLKRLAGKGEGGAARGPAYRKALAESALRVGGAGVGVGGAGLGLRAALKKRKEKK